MAAITINNFIVLDSVCSMYSIINDRGHCVMLPFPFLAPPPPKCSKNILTAQVLSTSQTRGESLTLPRTVLVSLFQWNQKEQRVAFPLLWEAHSIQYYRSQTTTDLRNASVRFSPTFHMAQGDSGHVIMSLRIKSQYSPNYPSLLPKNNGASVISSCCGRNRQGMTSTVAKCQDCSNVPLVLHQHEGWWAQLHALARDCP